MIFADVLKVLQLTYIARSADVSVRETLLGVVASAAVDSQQVSHIVLRGGNLCIEKQEVGLRNTQNILKQEDLSTALTHFKKLQRFCNACNLSLLSVPIILCNFCYWCS